MTLTPELQKMFEEKTKKLSLEFQELNCCQDEAKDFNKIKECLEKAKPFIHHLEDYYFPMIQGAEGLKSMILDLKEKQNNYLHTCHEFSQISSNADLTELLECLKSACKYIKEFEADLKELGF